MNRDELDRQQAEPVSRFKVTVKFKGLRARRGYTVYAQDEKTARREGFELASRDEHHAPIESINVKGN